MSTPNKHGALLSDGVFMPRMLIISTEELRYWKNVSSAAAWAAYRGLVIAIDVCQPCAKAGLVVRVESTGQCPGEGKPLDKPCMAAIASHCLGVWLSLAAVASDPSNN
jgi:hypothetical protein